MLQSECLRLRMNSDLKSQPENKTKALYKTYYIYILNKYIVIHCTQKEKTY